MSFVDRVGARNHIEAEVSGRYIHDAVTRFKDFLIRQGNTPEVAQKQAENLAMFFSTELPDVGVLEAVQQLRELLPLSMEEAVEVPKFAGRRKGQHPMDFFNDHYADAVRAGKIGPGRIAALDRRLYGAMLNELNAGEGPHKTIGEFFESVCNGPYVWRERVERRSRACAEILGTTEEVAAKFFRRLHNNLDNNTASVNRSRS